MSKTENILRLYTIFALILVTIAGFGSKLYSGRASDWFNNSLAGLFYEIFWCLLIFFIFPHLKPWKTGLWVFVITACLEFMQLWHPPFLQPVRNSFFGAALLGNTFNWLDFPYYLAGCLAGILMINFIRTRSYRL